MLRTRKIMKHTYSFINNNEKISSEFPLSRQYISKILYIQPFASDIYSIHSNHFGFLVAFLLFFFFLVVMVMVFPLPVCLIQILFQWFVFILQTIHTLKLHYVYSVQRTTSTINLNWALIFKHSFQRFAISFKAIQFLLATVILKQYNNYMQVFSFEKLIMES